MMIICYLLCLTCVFSENVLHVTLNVFSGTEDPSWTLRGSQASQLISKYSDSLANLPAADDPTVMRPIPWYRMGYRGFELTFHFDGLPCDGKRLAVYNFDGNFEWDLLFSGESELPSSVIEHVRNEILRLASLANDSYDADSDSAVNTSLKRPNVDPVRGPDNVTKYDPQNDCQGYFEKYQSQNNCYNYGNDIATNTFAQPGRGSGQKWSKNTCEDMKAAATRDGLVWAGTTLPTQEPDTGHFMALLIWPNTNFHWIRFDSDPAGYWSHKPGGTAVRNVDNNHKKITDPSKSDFSPWTQFCGYMATVPSKANIN